MLNIRIVLHVRKKVKSKLIQTQVHDIDACVHILDVHHFLLQAFQLLFAIVQISLFLVREQHVSATCASDVHACHSCLHTTFQAKVVIKFNIGPVVYELNHVVS